MPDSPALCPECGSMISVYEPPGGSLYLGCPEPFCGWMSESIAPIQGEVDLEDVLRDAQSDPDE